MPNLIHVFLKLFLCQQKSSEPEDYHHKTSQPYLSDFWLTTTSMKAKSYLIAYLLSLKCSSYLGGIFSTWIAKSQQTHNWSSWS